MKCIRFTDNESIYLDFIRVVASQLVLIGHAISYFDIFRFLHYPNVPWMQNIAVVIFFILSGIVITYSTSYKYNVGRYSFSLYFIDRFSRIFCAFIPAIIFVFIIDTISIEMSGVDYIYHQAFNIKTFIGNVFMLQDYPMPPFNEITSFDSARPFWTIAIEWWIYLTFGILFFYYRDGLKVNIKITLFLFICSIVPLYNLFGGRGNALTLYWIFGMLISMLYPRYKKLKISQVYKWLVLLIASFFMVAREYVTSEAYDTAFALSLSLFILISIDLVNLLTLKNWFINIIKCMAKYSFTLYLIHYSILDLLSTHYKGVSPYLLFILGFLFCNFLAILIGWITEGYFTKICKNKMYDFVKNNHFK